MKYVAPVAVVNANEKFQRRVHFGTDGGGRGGLNSYLNTTARNILSLSQTLSDIELVRKLLRNPKFQTTKAFPAVGR